MANTLKEFTRVAETSISTSTGDMLLAGAISPYGTFASKYSNGQTAFVLIAMGANWELSKITFNSGPNSISRPQVYASTNGGAAVNWGAGTKTISVLHPGFSDLDDAGRAALLEIMLSVSEVAVASATTCDILGAASPRVEITGTTTITSFGTGANKIRFVRFSGALLLTHNGTSLILPEAKNISTAAGDTCIVVSDGSSNARVLAYQRAGGVTVAGAIFGLTLSNNGSDATNDIDIAAGEAADSTGSRLIRLSAGITKRLDAAWAVGSGNGGLDTGSIANTTYHVWLIMRSDTGVVDVLFSTSASSPTMPANYDYKRRIGSIVRTGAAIKAFRQRGDYFRWGSSVLERTDTATLAWTVLTLTLPTGIVIQPILSGDFINSSGISSAAVGDGTDTGQTNQTYLWQSNIAQIGAGNISGGRFTNTSAQIHYTVNEETTLTQARLFTHGWIDDRGRSA